MKSKLNQKSLLCRQWRIKTQIVAFSLSMSAIILLVVGLIGFVHFNIVQGILIQSSQQLFDKQTNKQLQHYNALQNKLTQLKLIDNEQELNSINKLYQLVQHDQSMQNQPPFDCLNNANSNDTYAYNNSVCYMFCNQFAAKTNHQQFLNLTSLITQTLGIWNFEHFTFFTDIGNDEFFALHRGVNLTGFKVRSRLWYQQHISRYENTTRLSLFSDPFLAQVGVVYIAQTLTLTNTIGQIAGVAAIDIGLSYIPLLKNSDVNIIITNQSGHIILSKHYDDNLGIQETIEIYNESITGFNYEHWQLMLELVNRKPNIQLILYNSKMKCDLYVAATKIQYPQYYIITQNIDNIISFTKAVEFQYDKAQIDLKFDTFVIDFLTNFVCFLVGFMLLCLLLQFSLIHLVLLPIKKLNQITKTRVFSKFRIVQMSLSKSSSSTIELLQKAYYLMIDGITNVKQKNAKINSVQTINYPQTENTQLNVEISTLTEGNINSNLYFNICYWIRVSKLKQNR